MPVDSFELSRLGPGAFEQLVNALAMKVLGAGLSGFGPGSDGGRDGLFEGEAPYPSVSDRWKGTWYIQSKFHAPHLSNDPQKWLISNVRQELEEFSNFRKRRTWPDIWIVATNIDPSGVPETGAFDQCRALVEEKRPELASRFHIWGGRKVLDFLSANKEVADEYAEFITPGHVLASLRSMITGQYANNVDILEYFVSKRFEDQRYTKLEQAGASSDSRPGIEDLFVDLPIIHDGKRLSTTAADLIAHSCGRIHKPSMSVAQRFTSPANASAWFIKSGPGQGKSTVTQFISQVHRAAIMESGLIQTPTRLLRSVEAVKMAALRLNVWPEQPRIPIYIDLKEYSRWYHQKGQYEPRGVVHYLSAIIYAKTGLEVMIRPLKEIFATSRTLFVFDGLDEVPGVIKDEIASEVVNFINMELAVSNSDAFTICTSRPQGYSGQYAHLECADIAFAPLLPDESLACAKPLLAIDRTQEELEGYIGHLEDALRSDSVKSLMTSPLQSHIMAVVVRDGGRPPDRRWQLFNNFYQVIRRREANKNHENAPLARLLQDDEKLISALHNRIGFLLHVRAETSAGAESSLSRQDLEAEIVSIVNTMQGKGVEGKSKILSEAARERLVLVNTPEDGSSVRFDVRPLQEYFAAEYIRDYTSFDQLRARLETLSLDPHWREVVYFVFSALIEAGRRPELAMAIKEIEDLETSNPLTRRVQLILGSGENLAWRLLAEGVLEHDKRIRGAFSSLLLRAGWKLMPPIVGSAVTGESREWVAELLFQDVVKRAVPSETVGASILLFFLFAEETAATAEFKVKFLTNDAMYQGAVLSRVCEWVMMSAELPDWALAFILDILSQDLSLDLDHEVLTSILTMLEEQKDRFESLKCRLKIAPKLVDLLGSILDLFLFGREEKAELVREEVKGWYKLTYYKHEHNIDAEWVRTLVEDAPQVGGYLGYVLAFLALRHHLHKEDAIELVRHASLRPGGNENCIPHYIRRELSPIWRSEIADKRSCIFRSGDIGVVQEYEFLDGVDASGIDLSQMNEFTAALTLHRCALNLDSRSIGVAVGNEVADLVDEEGAAYLFQVLGDLVGHGIISRDTAVSLTRKAMSCSEYMRYYPTTGAKGYPISLPDEFDTLSYVTESIFRNARGETVSFDGSEWYTRKRPIGAKIREYIRNVADLLPAISGDLGEEVRACAVILYLHHPDRDTQVSDALQCELPDIYREQYRKWFPAVCVWALTPLFKHNPKGALAVAAKVYDRLGDDLIARESMERGLRLWRELDQASVTSNYDDELWRFH